MITSFRRRLAIPLRGLCKILRNPVAIVIAIAKVELRVGISLLRRHAVPLDRQSLVRFNAQAIFIAVAEIALRIRISRLRNHAKFLKCAAYIRQLFPCFIPFTSFISLSSLPSATFYFKFPSHLTGPRNGPRTTRPHPKVNKRTTTSRTRSQASINPGRRGTTPSASPIALRISSVWICIYE